MNDKPDFRILNRQGGFTMMELLIAIAIFSIGFMAAGAMQTNSLNKVKSSQDKTQAMELLDRQVDVLKRIPLYSTDVWTWTGSGPVFVMSPEFVGNGNNPDYSVDFGTAGYQVSWWINTQHTTPNRWSTPTNDPGYQANIVTSEDITATVCKLGHNPSTDALLRVEFLKSWVTQH